MFDSKSTPHSICIWQHQDFTINWQHHSWLHPVLLTRSVKANVCFQWRSVLMLKNVTELLIFYKSDMCFLPRRWVLYTLTSSAVHQKQVIVKLCNHMNFNTDWWWHKDKKTKHKTGLTNKADNHTQNSIYPWSSWFCQGFCQASLVTSNWVFGAPPRSQEVMLV